MTTPKNKQKNKQNPSKFLKPILAKLATNRTYLGYIKETYITA